jgi:hypothetical protein
MSLLFGLFQGLLTSHVGASVFSRSLVTRASCRRLQHAIIAM